MDCIFCKILKGEIPCRKVFEDEKFIGILDAFPANDGHILVITKKHFENIFEIDEDTLGQAHKITKKLAEKIKKSLDISNVNILQNNGSTAGQSVNHFHIHIIPRKENDTVVIKSKVVEISNSRLDELQNLLKI